LSAGKFHFEPPFTSLDHLVGERGQREREDDVWPTRGRGV